MIFESGQLARFECDPGPERSGEPAGGAASVQPRPGGPSSRRPLAQAQKPEYHQSGAETRGVKGRLQALLRPTLARGDAPKCEGQPEGRCVCWLIGSCLKTLSSHHSPILRVSNLTNWILLTRKFINTSRKICTQLGQVCKITIVVCRNTVSRLKSSEKRLRLSLKTRFVRGRVFS